LGDITLTINGERINCPPGTSVLEAAQHHGIKIPNLCHHPDLAPFGACRLCLVEEKSSGRLMASCVTPAAPDMAYLTDTPRILNHRKNIIRLMMAEHPESCIVCNKGNRCKLRQIAAQLDVGEIDLYPMSNYRPLEEANPFIIRDLSKCILCGKCIRADHELVVVGAIDYNLRGFESRPSTLHERGLEHSNCTFCGTCVSMCPTGALSTKITGHTGTPESEDNSTCGFCGVGCSITLGISGNKVIETSPSQLQGSVNGATMCVRGHFAHDFLNAPDRLEHPMIRTEGKMEPVSWNDALEYVAKRLLEIKKSDGPQSIGFLGSSKCSNEENFLFQRLARVYLETNNVDNGGYLLGRSVLNVVNERTGGGERIKPFASLEKAECIFLLGADPSHSVPVLSYYIKRAAKKGVPLIIADPRKTDLVPFSSLWLRPKLKTDSLLINSLAALLWKGEAYDKSFLQRYAEGFKEYGKALYDLDMDEICKRTSVDMDLLEQATDLLKPGKTAFVVGHGVLQQRFGIETINALLNLCLMTGSLGLEHAGIFPIIKENNQIGSWDMGTVPDALPGRKQLGDNEARKKWERIWGVKISPDNGLNVVRMIEEAEKGNLKALYVMGENPLRSLPQPERVRKALNRLDLLVVQDILNTETSGIAHVVLPGAAFSEKGGSFTNMEGRIQCFEPTAPPPVDAKPDWEILDLLGVRMGAEKAYKSIERVREEITRGLPMYGALKEKDDVLWVRPQSLKALYRNGNGGELIRFARVELIPNEDRHPKYPFTAVFYSERYHMGNGTRTASSMRIKDFRFKGDAKLSPDEGERLNLQEGDTVRISSPHGSVERVISWANGVSPGLIYLPMAYQGNTILHLMELTLLGEGKSPGWKSVRVDIYGT